MGRVKSVINAVANGGSVPAYAEGSAFLRSLGQEYRFLMWYVQEAMKDVFDICVERDTKFPEAICLHLFCKPGLTL